MKNAELSEARGPTVGPWEQPCGLRCHGWDGHGLHSVLPSGADSICNTLAGACLPCVGGVQYEGVAWDVCGMRVWHCARTTFGGLV